MLIAAEEKRSQSSLFVFIDLLFLLVAFFTLLLFFVQTRGDLSEKEMNAVHQTLSRLSGEEVNLPQAIEKLEEVVDRFLAEQAEEAERSQRLAEREKRRQERDTIKIRYTLYKDGRIGYKGNTYTLAGFKAEVVDQWRQTHWLAFTAYAEADTPFGEVVKTRRALLRDSNEFDTYWDNLTRSTGRPEPSGK